VLRHLLGTGETRPFELYGALVEAAGALAAFKLREAAELPAYDHENPWPCFSGPPPRARAKCLQQRFAAGRGAAASVPRPAA
jgi:hypothetical protein